MRTLGWATISGPTGRGPLETVETYHNRKWIRVERYLKRMHVPAMLALVQLTLWYQSTPRTPCGVLGVH